MRSVPDIKIQCKVLTPFWEKHMGEDGFLFFHGFGSMEGIVATSMHRGNCILSSYVYYDNYVRFKRHAKMVRKNAHHIFIDSGILGMAKAGIIESDWGAYQKRVVEAAFDFQADYTSHSDLLCKEDVLTTFNLEKPDVLRITVENAKLFTEEKIPGEKIYVIQGWTPEDYLWCLEEYKKAGIPEQGKYFGVGSLVGKPPKETYQILKSIRQELPQHKIHAFGLANLSLIKKLREDGLINSTDNAMAARLACLNKKYVTPRWSASKMFGKKDFSYNWNWWMNVYLTMFNMAALEQGLFLDSSEVSDQQMRLVEEEHIEENLPIFDYRSLGFGNLDEAFDADALDNQMLFDVEENGHKAQEIVEILPD